MYIITDVSRAADVHEKANIGPVGWFEETCSVYKSYLYGYIIY